MVLKDKVAIITGATGGIGSVISKKLIQEGAKVALIGRNENSLQNLKNSLGGRNIITYVVENSDESSIRNVISEINRIFETIDILINNAGIQEPIGKFIDNDLNLWRKNIEVNLYGTIYYSYYCLKFMTKNKKGKIINLSGGGATSSRKYFSAYACSKTAIVRFTEIIAEELKEYNIDVNAVAPGAINTKMLDEIIIKGESLGKEYTDALIRKEKGGNDPEIVADLICFLASDESKGITGKLISAPWDLWKGKEFMDLIRSDKDFATLRRIDNKFFIKVS